MKRFLLEVAAFLVLQVAIAFAFESAYHRLLGRDHYLAALEDKTRLLDSLPPPRVLLVGGSSLAFGVDSARLSRALGRPVVNLGLNAGLGLDLILGPAERAMASGDLVLVSPEYRLFEEGLPLDVAVVWQQVARVPAAARDLPPRAVPMLLDEGLSLPSQRLQALWHYVRDGRPESIYWRTSFDAHGDFVGHLRLDTLKASGQHVWIPGTGSATDACDRLSRFAARARRVGASVVIVPPPIPADDFQRQGEAIDRLWATVAERTGLPVAAGTPCGRSRFFDTAYHLTRQGRRKRTDGILQALAALGWTPPEVAAAVR